jgi:hypothetical protein
MLQKVVITVMLANLLRQTTKVKDWSSQSTLKQPQHTIHGRVAFWIDPCFFSRENIALDQDVSKHANIFCYMTSNNNKWWPHTVLHKSGIKNRNIQKINVNSLTYTAGTRILEPSIKA